MSSARSQLVESIEQLEARHMAAGLIRIASSIIDDKYGGWIPAAGVEPAVRSAVRRAMAAMDIPASLEPWQAAEIELSLIEIITEHVYDTMEVH